MAEVISRESVTGQGFTRTFRALRHRNYRLFFLGQGISLLGTWMQTIAMTWLVYRLTNSAFLLGLVGFAGQLPTFLVSSFAGVLADRADKRSILVATQSTAMAQALLLGILTLSGTIAVWHLLVLSAFLGLVNAFDVPTRQSFLIEMLETKEDLGNAIALNSSMFNSARLIGPSIAGILIGVVGEGWCFLLNAASFLAVIVALLAMRIVRHERSSATPGVMQGWAQGFRYAWRSLPIRAVLALLAVTSIAGMPYAVLMPVFARDVLGGGPHTLGFLMGSAGVGALAGALTLASRRSARGLSKWIPIFSATFGIGLVLFSASRTPVVSMAMLLVAGYGMMTTMASCNTILQTVTSDDMRGRVMSLYTMAFMGMMPFGSLAAGSLASRIGSPETVLFSGLACIVTAGAFALVLPAVRAAVRASAHTALHASSD